MENFLMPVIGLVLLGLGLYLIYKLLEALKTGEIIFNIDHRLREIIGNKYEAKEDKLGFVIVCMAYISLILLSLLAAYSLIG